MCVCITNRSDVCIYVEILVYIYVCMCMYVPVCEYIMCLPGEDGPTHQPVEMLETLRAVPNLVTIRPCDGNEVVGAYVIAMELTHTPTVISLSRQACPSMAPFGSSPEKVCTVRIHARVSILSVLYVCTFQFVCTLCVRDLDYYKCWYVCMYVCTDESTEAENVSVGVFVCTYIIKRA